MDTGTIATIGIGVALMGIGVTVLIILFRGFFRLGQLFQRIDTQDENIRQIREQMRQSDTAIREDIRQLTAEMRESNQRLAAEMRESNQRLAAEMRESNQRLAAEIRQTNETVIALANHRHGQDGNIIFILPVPPGS